MGVPVRAAVFAPNTTAKAAEVNADFDALFAALDPAQEGLDGANMKVGTPGELWIADSSGVYQRTALSQDGTIDGTGKLTLAMEKAYATLGGNTSAFTGSYADVGLAFTAVKGGVYEVTASLKVRMTGINAVSGAQSMTAQLVNDVTPVADTLESGEYFGLSSTNEVYIHTDSKTWQIAVAATKAVKVQAKINLIGGTVVCLAGSSLAAKRIA